MASIAVIGAGAIGGYVAAAASRNGHQVQLCVRSPMNRLRVDLDGGRYRPVVPVRHRPDQAEPVDLVVLTTKAHDSAGAARWFAGLCGQQTTIVVMQNGVDHVERIQPLAPNRPIVPALVHIAVDRIGPGHVVHRSGRRIVLPTSEAADLAAEALHGDMIDVEQVPDFFTASWRKLMLNVAANPITALTGRRLGVLDLPAVRELAIGVLRETVAVGNAAGAALTERDVTETMRSYKAFGPAVGTSMLADRLAGRPIEYELITAAVVRAAARHGVAVPLNRTLLALLHGTDASAAPLAEAAAAPATATARADRGHLAAAA